MKRVGKINHRLWYHSNGFERNKEKGRVSIFFQKAWKAVVHFVCNSSGGNISQATFLMS